MEQPPSTPSRGSVVVGYCLLTATFFGGLIGFSKYGDPDSSREAGALVVPYREDPLNKMTPMLSREQMHAARFMELGSIVTPDKDRSLERLVRSSYRDAVLERSRPFSGELQRELTAFVAKINFYEADSHVRAGDTVLIPHLDSFVSATNAYQELTRPNHLAWIPRASQELFEYGYLIARENLTIPDERIGFTFVTQAGAQWEHIMKACYPDLARYPKTRAHLLQAITEAHGASHEHDPEQGRRLFLPSLKSLLQGAPDPASLLRVTRADIVHRFHPELERLLALEQSVWTRFLSPEISRTQPSPTP